jgi:hypothetical protein
VDEKPVAAEETGPSLEEAPAEEATTPSEEPTPKPDPLIVVEALKSELETLKQQRESIVREFRTSQSTSDANTKKLNRQIERLSAQMEAIATRGMDDNEARTWKAERALERANEAQTEISQQQTNEAAWNDFRTRGAELLEEQGIARDDVRLTTAFQKYAKNAESTKDWDIALTRAIADVHRDERRKAAEENKTVAEKTREEERNKVKNEKRQTEGKTDTGSPASGAPKDWNAASDAEVLAEGKRNKDRHIRATMR